MELLEIMKNRRSVRTYTEESIPTEKLEQILHAGLLSPSGRAIRPWELIVVQNKEMLQKLAGCRDGSADMLKGASAAIVVAADPDKTDVWIEDCSIAMTQMHLMADSLGVGSCWIQVRLRDAGKAAPVGTTTEGYLQGLLGIPKEYKVEAILSLGMPKNHPAPRTLEELPKEKIHWGKMSASPLVSPAFSAFTASSSPAADSGNMGIRSRMIPMV